MRQEALPLDMNLYSTLAQAADTTGFVTSATGKSYCFGSAPTLSQSCSVPFPKNSSKWHVIGHRTSPTSWSDRGVMHPHVTDIDRCPTVNHHPSSVSHFARALAHDNIVDRVLNCEHERTTLVGVLFLVLVDCSVSVPRISRPTVTRIVILLSARATGFVASVGRSFLAFALCLCLGLFFCLCLSLGLGHCSCLHGRCSQMSIGPAPSSSDTVLASVSEASHCQLTVQVPARLGDDT